LTALIARENGLGTDEAGFRIEMEEQKNRSRNAAQLETGDWVEIRKAEQTQFLGYDQLEAEIRIARYRKVSQKNKTVLPTGIRPDPLLWGIRWSGGRFRAISKPMASKRRIFRYSKGKQPNSSFVRKAYLKMPEALFPCRG
jgi:hypothetical protein